ncbi:MAG: hypothetical protein ACI9GM_000634 [Salibacteraceae bacterium]|jgi:hypothetical protein
MNKLIGILAVLVVLISCQAKVKIKNKGIEGLWKLTSMKIRNTETGVWSDYRAGMQGYLLYDGNKNMTIHLTDKDYEKTEMVFPSFTDTISMEALQHLTKSYYYIGEYQILNDSIVQHTRISHSNPGDWGKVVKRHFSFIGDTLVITPTEQRLANLELRWVK